MTKALVHPLGAFFRIIKCQAKIAYMYNTKFEVTVKRALAEETNVHCADLSKKIVATIEKRQRTGGIIRLVFFSFTTLLSFVVGILLWRSEGQAIISSDVGQLLSLLFSDFGVITSYWREYLSSLVESIPFVSVAMVGALIWAAGASIYELVKNSLIFIHHPHQADV